MSNRSLPNNVTSFLEFSQFVQNNIMNSILGPAIMIMIFTVFFISLNFWWDSWRSLIGASMLMAITGVFLRILGLINNWWMVGGIIIAAIVVYVTYAYEV